MLLGGPFKEVAPDLYFIIDTLNIKKGARILDIGTGDGKMAITLALNGLRIVTGEPKDDGSIYANRNWHQNAVKVNVDNLIEFKFFSVENLLFNDNYFDYIFSYGSFHHFNKKKEALKEILRIAKQRAKVVIIEPNETMMRKIQKKHPDHPDADDPRDYLNNIPVRVKLKELNTVNAYLIQKL